jgi:hypothetical protein
MEASLNVAQNIVSVCINRGFDNNKEFLESIFGRDGCKIDQYAPILGPAAQAGVGKSWLLAKCFPVTPANQAGFHLLVPDLTSSLYPLIFDLAGRPNQFFRSQGS